MGFLTVRAEGAERLDNLTEAGPDLERTLGELGWLNRWLGTTRRAVRAVRSLRPPADAHIVDLGCGGGHVLAALREAYPAARLTGVDGNPAVLEVARRRVPSGSFVQLDVLAPDAVVPDCDVLVSTQFIYHFPDAALGAFVDRQTVRCGWAMVGLVRSPLAYRAFGAFGPWAGLSDWTVQDGQRAIERAFRPDELRAAFGRPLEVHPGPWPGLPLWYAATTQMGD